MPFSRNESRRAGRRAQALLEQSRAVKDRRRDEDKVHEKTNLATTEAGLQSRAGLQAQTQKDVAETTGQFGLKRQTMQGDQGMAQQRLVGSQRVGEMATQHAFLGDQSNLDRAHKTDLQHLSGAQATQANRETGAMNLIGQGLSGDHATNIAGSPSMMPLDLSGMEVPLKPENPKLQILSGDPILGAGGVWNQPPPRAYSVTSEGATELAITPQQGLQERKEPSPAALELLKKHRNDPRYQKYFKDEYGFLPE